MSDDLISRKAVIEILVSEFNKHVDIFIAGRIIGLINDLPAAFDKEKVNEEIREKGEKVCASVKCSGKCEDCEHCEHGILVKAVIKIVDKSGKI